MVELSDLAQRLGHRLLDRAERIATAESCTGGWIAKCLTDIPGSSGWFDLGFVTYSNDAKHRMLGVSNDVLEAEGAVSESAVLAMAKGAARVAGADWAISVSGIAGPTGGSVSKPVGTVWLGAFGPGILMPRQLQLAGDRNQVRCHATRAALLWMLDLVE